MTSCSIRSLNDNDAKQLHKMCHRFSAHELVETRDPHGPTFRITYDKEEMFALEYLVCRRALMLDQLLIDVPADHPLIRAEHFSLVPPQTKAAQDKQISELCKTIKPSINSSSITTLALQSDPNLAATDNHDACPPATTTAQNACSQSSARGQTPLL